MSQKLLFGLLCASLSLWLISSSPAADPLPGTKLLTVEGDLAAKMVAGIHKYLDRELERAPQKRDETFKADLVSKEAWTKALPAKRERLRKLLGVVDERVKPHLEYVGGPDQPSLRATLDGCKVYAVRWAVLPGIDAEGLLIEPKDKPTANVVAVPHADQLPEELAGLTKGDDFALRLARRGCRVLVPTLIDRKDELSGNAKLKKQTNIPHREFVYRMAYELGRTLTGFEVQKVLAAVDWFAAQDAKLKVGVIGYGDGGMIALDAAALDPRFTALQMAGHFGLRERLHDEPIDCNAWGLLTEFGDAELGALTAPADCLIDASIHAPRWAGPREAGKPGQAAPGTISGQNADRDGREEQRLETLRDLKPRLRELILRSTVDINPLLGALGLPRQNEEVEAVLPKWAPGQDTTVRQKRQFDQLVAFNQKLWRESDAVRKEFWKKADSTSPEAWEKSCEWYRDYFHAEVIGKLPEPTVPLNPRSRQVYDEPTFTGYEVMLDVYDDVFAEGILLLPKGIKEGEKRPVVVCQHGLEGTPRSCIDEEKRPTYCRFARTLVEKGYIVYCPQNPYSGGNTFRQLQRKANPLQLSLFSFIVRQHQRTLDWLETLPNVDAKKIGFYGLSYGGKTAMRVPAIEKRYCLSVCSGDFNEWIGKNVSVDLDRSYMWSGEYEMYEFDLGNTFNYAEMAYLIAPRPFMVERGHDDPVGTDEMVSAEYAKVRYLYANKLKLPDRTAIDYKPGGHQVFLKGTLDFLEKHLGKPK